MAAGVDSDWAVQTMEATLESVEAQAARPDRGPVVALLVANAISYTGNMLTALAIPWFVLQTTGSAARTGLVAFAQMLPLVAASFLGGALVDRVSAKRLSIAADVMSGATVAAVPLLHHTVGLAFWQLLALVFLGALLDAPGGTAREKMLPDLVGRAGMRLERANAATQMIQSGAALLGPPLAGILVVTLGTSNVLWLDAATFAISATIVAAAVPAMARRAAEGRRYLDEVLDGLRFLRRDRLLSTVLVLAAILNFVATPIFSVVLPVYTKEIYDSARALGLLMGGVGAGSLGGALIFGVIGPRLPRRTTVVVMITLASLAITALVVFPPLPAALALMIAIGLAMGTVNPLIVTVFQERIPPDLRGRVFGTVAASTLVAAPAGMLLTGAGLETMGLRTVLFVIAGVQIAVTIALATQPALREMDRQPDRVRS